jgi:hypothetical protein
VAFVDDNDVEEIGRIQFVKTVGRAFFQRTGHSVQALVVLFGCWAGTTAKKNPGAA